MARMTGFVFQDEYIDRLSKLSDDELGRLVRALAKYHATGEEQELEGRESIAYDFIKFDIDRIDQKCEARSATNRNNRIQGMTNADEPQRNATNDDELQRTVTNADETAQDKDKVKDKDKETEIQEQQESACARVMGTKVGTVVIDPLILKIQQELNGLTDTHYQALDDYRRELSDELVSHAIDQAVGNGVRNWVYVEKILREYTQDGIRTIGEAKAREATHNRQRSYNARGQPQNSVNPFLDALQRGDFGDAG